MRERVFEDALRPAEVAHVAERVAQVSREPNLVGRVVRIFLRDTREASLEELYGPLRLAEGRVALAQGCVNVGSLGRGDEPGADRGLQAFDGGRVVPGPRFGEADCDARAERGGRVAGGNRLVEDLPEDVLRLFGVIGEPELELGIGEPKLALVDLPEVGPRFQVLDGDAELSRELPESLHRRAAGAGLDARDVGVRHAGRRELALRIPSLDAQSAKTSPD